MKNTIFKGLLSFYFLNPFILFGQFEIAQVDSYIRSAIKSDGPGITVIITKGEETIYHKAVGMADLELNIPMEKNHILRIGSITKQFTAAALLKLYDEGILDLEDEITKYIPNYPTFDQEIIIEQLLNHTSGIPSYTQMSLWTPNVRKQDFTVREFMEKFKPESLDFVPGTRFKYNNTGYYLLGYIIETASRESYADFLKSEIFQPIGMKNTYYDNTSEIIRNRIPGYEMRNGKYINADYLSMTQPYAAGGLISTTEDLAKWNRALVTGKVITPATLEMAWSPTVLLTGKYHPYGYGFEIKKKFDLDVITHDGNINGFLSNAMYFPDEDLYIAVLSNCTCNNAIVISENLAAIMLKKTVKVAEEVKETADLSKFEGIYNLVPGFDLTITQEEGQLMIQATDQDKFPLFPDGGLVFFLKNVDAQIEFLQGSDGNINELILFQNGMSLPGKRVN